MNPAGLALRLFARNLWTRSSLLWIAVSFLVVGLGSWVERRAGLSGAADRSLSVVVFGFVIPVCAYAVFHSVTDGKRLDLAIEVLARHGLSRRKAFLGAVAAIALALSVCFAPLSALAIAISRESSDPALTSDLIASASIGAMAGAAYSAWLALGSTFGARGGGRGWFLALDLVLGSSNGPLGLLFPRAALKNLLGGEPTLGLSQAVGAALLFVSALGAMLVALRRTPD